MNKKKKKKKDDENNAFVDVDECQRITIPILSSSVLDDLSPTSTTNKTETLFFFTPIP